MLQNKVALYMTVSKDRDDNYLVERIAIGDQEAFNQLFGRLSRDVFKLSYSLLLDHQMAEDATQEIFVKIWKNAAHWQPEAMVKTWILKITRNHCLDILRKQKNDQKKYHELYKEHLTTYKDVTLDNAESKFDKKRYEKIIKNALFLLPERQREAVTLVYYMDVHNSEAALIMGIKNCAFDSLLARARRNLRDWLDGEENELKGLYSYGTE